MGQGNGSPLERALRDYKRLVLEHGIQKVSRNPNYRPFNESFWHFSLRRMIRDSKLRPQLADALAVIYQNRADENYLELHPLVSLNDVAEPLVKEINVRLNIPNSSRLTLFNEGLSSGGPILRFFSKCSVAYRVDGVYSAILGSHCPKDGIKVSDAIALVRRELPSFQGLRHGWATTKLDLVLRLCAFGKHREWLAPDDPRYFVVLPEEPRYRRYVRLAAGADADIAQPVKDEGRYFHPTHGVSDGRTHS